MTSTGPTWIWMLIPLEKRGRICWEARRIDPPWVESARWVAGDTGDLSLAELLLLILHQGLEASLAREWLGLLNLDPWGWQWEDCQEAFFALLCAVYKAVRSNSKLTALKEAVLGAIKALASQQEGYEQLWYWQLLEDASLTTIAEELGWDTGKLKSMARELEGGQPF